MKPRRPIDVRPLLKTSNPGVSGLYVHRASGLLNFWLDATAEISDEFALMALERSYGLPDRPNSTESLRYALFNCMLEDNE